MTDTLSVTTERVDDLPVLLEQMKRMGIPEVLDETFPTHGNWGGASLGWTAAVWLTHILSKGEHRLSWAQRWVAGRRQTLEISSGQTIDELDWSDDRLALVLDALSETAKWKGFETGLNRRLFRVYNLKPKRIRLDSTTASGYWTVTEDGLFQFGHSKDQRPDLPQVKVMLSALDPLGMPVATQVVAGDRADDPLYIPAIRQVSESLDEHGLLYVGDSKMAAKGTRAFIQAQGDHYLCPLPDKQLPQEQLKGYLRPVWSGEQALQPIYRTDEAGEQEQLAEGYEIQAGLTHTSEEGQITTWTERHLIVRSLQFTRAATDALYTRLERAQVELRQLLERKPGKERIEDTASLRAAANTLLKRHRVEGLLILTLEEHLNERRVRAYGERPARTEQIIELDLQVSVDQQAVDETVRGYGWRVYATNQPQDTLPLEQAVLAYREEYLIERGFSRLKGKPLSLSPTYLQSEARTTALIRLLSLGLRILTLIEFQVRQKLAETKEKLAGLAAGNPKRATARPTVEAMLESFRGIDLTLISMGGQMLRHITPLSEVQKKILALLDFPCDIYTRLTTPFSGSPEK
jgi:transposase